VMFVRSRRCFCLLSRIPLFEAHVRVLRMLVADRAATIAAHAQRLARDAASGGEGLEQWAGNGFGPGALRILEDYLRAPVVGPEACRVGPDGRPEFTVAVGGEAVRVAWSGADERDEAEAAARRFGMRFLLGYLSMPTIMTLVTALLLERRTVIECPDPFVLSAIGPERGGGGSGGWEGAECVWGGCVTRRGDSEA
jgi:hypothetical protein